MVNFTDIKPLKLVVILGHSNEGNDGDKMTLDGEIRTRSAAILWQNDKTEKIFLLGGGNDKIKGKDECSKMSEYLLENFSIDEKDIISDSTGKNTIENVLNAIERLKKMKVGQREVLFLTSDYNVLRLKLCLEIFGLKNAQVMSSERVLISFGDKLAQAADQYLFSKEYQSRLSYEIYWLYRTICDEKYTEEFRKEINLTEDPMDYFEKQSKRTMENIDE